MLKRASQRWLDRQEAALRAEFGPRLEATRKTLAEEEARLGQQAAIFHEQQAELLRQRHDTDDLLRRIQDRKEELARSHEELKAQLRIIEAKASPDDVFVTAFALGYGKAWDTMFPIMLEGVQKTRETLRNNTITTTLGNLEPLIQRRAVERGTDVERLRLLADLKAKQGDFLQKQTEATSDVERRKYGHYLEALSWMLNGHRTE